MIVSDDIPMNGRHDIARARSASHVLDYALRYASFGWPVLPIKPRQKTPRGGNGFDHATTDEHQIREWFTRWPDANIGIALAPAGLCAIDIDPRNGGSPSDVDIPLVDVLMAKTGGGGMHWMLRVPEGAELPGRLGPGIDVKWRGYILVEPSIHPSGKPYSWLDWNVLTEPVPRLVEAPQWLLPSTQGAQSGQASGNYDDWLAELLGGAHVHDSAVRIVGRMVRKGLDDAAIKAWFAAVALSVAQERGAERAAELRGDELDRMLKGARRKGYAPPPIPEIGSDPADGDDQPDEPTPQRVSAAPMESDIWLAALFAKRFAGRFRWSPGLDWMVNRGAHWERDNTLDRYSRAKELCAQIARAKEVANDSRRSIASAKTVNAVLTLSRAEHCIATPIEAWDRDPMVLNTPTGPIDLESGKAFNIGECDLFTQITTVAPNPAMRTPNWLRFVTEIFCCDLEMVEFIQRLAGYCLTGDRREQKLPVLYGTGANGKSVLVDELLAIMGSYALNLPSEALMRQHQQAHPTELAQLRGKRLAVSSELEDGAYWAESRIKALTGDATLTARFMRQDFFEFRQTQKHVVVGNFKPRLKGDDPAIARRLLLVPFTEKFTGSRCDPLLPRKLASERPGILAWMIEGAVKWARDGLLIPARVRDASTEYLAANDDIALWLDDCCLLEVQQRTPSATLYASYRAYKEAAGERPQSMNPWSARMGQRFRPYRQSTARGFEGVALRESAQAGAYRQASQGA